MWATLIDNEWFVGNELKVNGVTYLDVWLRGQPASWYAENGIYPYRELPYNETLYRCTGYIKSLVDNEVVAAPVLVDIPTAEVVTRQIAKINPLRETKRYEPIVYNGNTFDADAGSQNNIIATVAAIAAGLTLPANFVWRTHDNVDVAFTDADMKALGNALLERTNYLYTVSWQHKAALQAIASDNTKTAADALAYDLTIGW